MLPITLDGRTALITGAGRGIGRALALLLARSGACVFLTDIDREAVEASAKTIGKIGGRAGWMDGDVTLPGFPEQFVQACLSLFGSVDIIVNNAGYTWDNVIQKTLDEQFQAMLDVHLVAPFRLLRAAAPSLREKAKAEAAGGLRVMRKVVNITSIAGTDGNAGQSAYSSGKAGIVGLTKTLAKEWGRYNINVNAVAFGLIETRLTQPLSGEAASIAMKGRQIPVGVPVQFLSDIRSECPLGRLGTVEEAANAAFFLCSPLSDYVTGEVLVCSGGLHF